ncbi:hypothetical protein DXG03_009167 [Asterophora parasitica]|uniref:Xylanolytic transcriptional activator regulatory domain-containing protein n=1 Tax=Asterophora parasitica TaxID=117018 RepID=A0A9P7GBA7_9AGAR|nr:hypothetical protein DXG03_009167 [Asterophora parasitica]
MPAEPSYLRGASQRISRKTPTEDDVDIRRARGEVSSTLITEQLFLTQPTRYPVQNAEERRGCPSICPNGTLSTGQGTRFVLADTTQLHAKIMEMGQRILQLEDALAIFQSGVSSETHPLLRDEFLHIKFGPDKGKLLEREEPTRDTSIDSIDALGTLTIGDHGQVKYFGRSAGSEALFLVPLFYCGSKTQLTKLKQAGEEIDSMASGVVESDQIPQVSVEVSRLSAAFPFGVEGDYDKALDLLFEYLPSQHRAWSLCETYMEHAAWSFRPLKRDEIVDDIMAPIYKSMKERRATDTPGPHTVFPHTLAVLFLVFALGGLVDLTLEPYSAESDTYYHLSRACMSLYSVFDSPEVSTVQAVVLMGAFQVLGAKKNTTDSSWNLISLGCKLAQCIGLHRDSARFDLDAKTVERRRALFWEAFSYELFYCLGTGRPPSISLSYIDCELPVDDEATLDENGNVLKGFYQWKYEFTKEIMTTVTELTLTAEPPNYQTVLDLDRKVRAKSLPPHLNMFLSPEDRNCSPSVYMRGCILAQYRTVTLLYIHRSFFAQAMLDHPANPLRSPYAPSFLAAYRCASGVIKSNLNHFERFPDLCSRSWAIWTHLFSAAIIVGTIVTRSPSSSMAASAFIELGLACDLFEKGAMSSRRARNGLAILCKLRERAFQVYSQFRSGNVTPNAVLAVGSPDYGEDELALFGGQTRVLASKLLKKIANRPASGQSTPSSSSSDKSPTDPAPDVHPSLVEYLSNIPSSYSSPSESPTQASASLTTAFSQQHIFQQNDQFIPPPDIRRPPPLSFPASPVTDNSHAYFTAPPDFYYSSISDFGNFEMKSDSESPENLVDLGMMLTGDSGMDEQWMSFMRESGLLEGNGPSMSS